MHLKNILLLVSIPLFLTAQTARDSLFFLGPQKDWSNSKFQEYNRWSEMRFLKPTAGSLRQNAIMNGNKITTEIWNYGSISSPGNRITDIIWEGLGYGYEFGPFVAAEVPVPPGSHQDVITIINGQDTSYVVHIVSDGLTSSGGEVSPDNLVRWGWQPISIADDGSVEYVDLRQDFIPTSDDKDRDGDGKPDSGRQVGIMIISAIMSGRGHLARGQQMRIKKHSLSWTTGTILNLNTILILLIRFARDWGLK